MEDSDHAFVAVFVGARRGAGSEAHASSVHQGRDDSLLHVPVEAARKENPVSATPESLARGKKQYGYDCAMCHGKEGNGKGDVAVDMKLGMHDETNPATLKDRSDGELFYIIKKGKDQMPPEGDRVKDERIWDMVNYVRSFANKGAVTEKPAEEKAPN